MSIPLFRPSIKRKDMDSVLTCMVSDRLEYGRVCEDFVSAILDYLDMESGVPLREYYRAIETVFQALNLKSGSKVILSPLAHHIYKYVMEKYDIIPVYIDVSEDAPIISTETVENLASDSYDAVLIDYTLGYIPEIEKIIASDKAIIEDISCGIGGKINGKRCGGLGNYTILSLEPENIITAGGGTAVMAKGKKETSRLKKVTSSFPPELLMPDMNAALGHTQIKEIESFIARRLEIAQVFQRSLLKTKHKQPFKNTEAQNIPFSFPVCCNKGVKEVMKYAKKQGIEARLAFEKTIFAKEMNVLDEFRNKEYPNAINFYYRTVLFPLYPMLSKKDVLTIEKVLSTLP